MTPLMYACQAGDLQLVEFLLKKGAKTKYDMGRSAPLHVTTHLEIAKLLLENGNSLLYSMTIVLCSLYECRSGC